MKEKQNIPPKLATKFLLWFLRDDLAEEVLGDLEERFYDKLNKGSLKKAKWDFWLQVFNYFRPFALKHLNTSNMNHFGLFRSYFKISWRNLLKQKLYSFINIGGLAIGLASFILIVLYVEHELTYDRFYGNAENIYRISMRQKGNNFKNSDLFAVTPAPLPALLEQEFPEVKKATSVSNHSYLLKNGGDNFWEMGLWADNNYFEVFDYPMLLGNPKKALAAPNSMVITESLASKLFDFEDPLGKTITLDFFGDNLECTVTGLIPDLPEKSSLKFQYIVSMNTREGYVKALDENLWNNNSYITFFALNEGADPQQLEDKMREAAIPRKYEIEGSNNEYFVNSLLDLHLQNNINFDVGVKGDKNYIYFYSTIAFLILVLACINYMNLAIARSINRAREVGLRKVVGAFRRQVISQFLGEAVLITLIAFVLSLVLIQLLLPIFSYLIERPLSLGMLENSLMLPGLLLLLLVVGVFSGSYPAFYMSGIQPLKVLKGKVDSRKGSGFQRFLVVVQYSVSICLIISTFVIYQQMEYVQTKELGYNKDHIITIPIKDINLSEKLGAVKNEWIKNPNIISVAQSGELPIDIGSSRYIDEWEGKQTDDPLFIYFAQIGVDYLKLFDIKLLAGRNFNLENTSDLDVGTILNETAVSQMGWTPEEAVGKEFVREGNDPDVIIGVVEDFHMHSLHDAIHPLFFKHFKSKWRGVLSAKVSPDHLPETIAFIESTIKPLSDYPFEYAFLDDKFDQLYKSDLRLGEIFGFFTVLALVIASLGLFGLAAFSATQRTKEIGIRKVLGASTLKIFSLLARNFLQLIVISFAISIPIAWLAMNSWLENFAFRIEVEWWMFAMVGFVVFLVAYFTIGYQSIKAAMANPVKNLRTE
ncbi:ABC transporter permease [Flammeovirgaceae bacterium SG7u.111]|nr:ABC transporter permease [Flammeovirgaceae bacterium SG7u.132]WPO33351.1 ABC transporter permease [Flammeovirgaceae bacterium SG7u.111]